ncbi:MrcB family domain-containing protein [Ampullimonas aquatilis]|uniref:MrcB family domain-containing protein n=1 Tax=Ampullimonas aquatilis TaxID=1341549 RepID=UPI003C7791D8
MGLHAVLTLLLEEYLSESKMELKKNPLASLIREDIPKEIRSISSLNERYLIEGSPGKGNWARVPWIAIFDRLITESAQDAYYLVYLVKENCEGVFLSLNQGVTSIRSQYGEDTKNALRVKAADYAARLGDKLEGLEVGQIDLSVSSSSSLGALYEYGSICSIYYSRVNVPNDEILFLDLRRFLDLYLTLASSESQLFEQVDAEEDELGIGVEDLRNLREHKRIERNKSLALQAKKIHGYICKACGFDFEKEYGSIGAKFIEAHHLVPLSNYKNQKVTLDAKNDFTVLCSNCHRMIHKTEFVNKIEEFRAKYVIK